MKGIHRLKPIAAALAAALATHQAAGQVPAPTMLPTGGRVVAGQATIIQSGSAMNIQQGSDRAILNWNSFSIGSQASVAFQQPSSSSIALNRVLGSDPSAIYGTLSANGQVFLINPSGVVFGPGARVDVNGLVASTLNIRDSDFLSGNFRFTRDGATGSVLNQGELIAKYVALLAPEVRNEGVIVARQGTVALAAGEAVTLGITGNDLIRVQVDQASIDTLVQNKRLIQADAGTVVMSAQSAHGLVGKVVNTDTIEAKGITTDGGVVRLVASSAIEHSGSITADAGQNGKGGSVTLIADLSNPDSRTTVSGSISARGGSESGDGGFVETSASKLKILGGTRVDTRAPNGRGGTWLLDPADFTVSATGDIDGATLSGNIVTNGDTIIDTNNGGSGTAGDLFVNENVNWASSKLTLRAQRDVNVNATMSATGSASLAIEYGQGAAESGNTALFTVNGKVDLNTTGTFTTTLGNDGGIKNYTIVTDLTGLQAIDASPALNYALGTNFALAGTWTPIGNSVNGPFQGTFEGLGHTISGIANDAAVVDNVGFIGQTASGARVQNITVGVNLTGRTAVGGLVGNNAGGIIYNGNSTGTIALDGAVTGADPVRGIGGLAGMSNSEIIRSRSSVNITATGGQQDLQQDPLNPGPPGTSGYGMQGGIGGLVGTIQGGTVKDSYATGSVTGTLDVGGLVGFAAAPVDKSYSTGAVTGTTNPGGLIGAKDVAMTITNSFWDTDTSLQGLGSSAGGTGLDTGQMKTAANFTGAGWDTTRVWKIADGSYPVFITGPAVAAGILTINLNDSTRVYGVTTAPTLTLTGIGYTGTLLTGDNLTGATFGTALTNNLGVGDYAYSTANLIVPTFTFVGHTIGDYTISYSANKLTITKANLALTGTRTYDASTAVAGGILTATGVLGESFAVSGAGTLASKDVGTRAVQSLDSLALGAAAGGALAGNYNALSTIGSAVIISKADLALSGTRTYDGLAAVAGGILTANGVNGETFAITGSGTLASKDVGTRAVQSLDSLALGAGSGGAVTGNYNALSTTGSAVILTKADLTLAGTRAYNGLAAVAGGVLTANGVNGESFSLTGSGTLASKDVGTRAVQTLDTLALGTGSGGGLASNYNALSTTGSAVIISKADLALSGTRTYDGLAAIAGGILTANGVNSESFILTGSGTLASKDVGTRAVQTLGSLALGAGNSGAAVAANYNALSTTGSAVIISKADLTLSGSRTYDATTMVAGSVLAAAGVNGETFGVTGAGDASNLLTKNVQTGSTLNSLTGLSLGAGNSGAAVAGNYNALSTTGSSFTVNKATLTLSGTRTYDATTIVAGSVLTATGVGGETFGVTGAGDASNLASKNVGTAPLASLTNLALGTSTNGGLPGNYNAIATAGSSVVITQKALDILGLTIPSSVTGTTAGPVGLNGTPALMTAVAAGTSAAGAPYTGDVLLPFAGTAQGTSFTVSGLNLTGSVTGLTLNGANAGNYTLTGARVTGNVPTSTSVPSTTSSVGATVENLVNSNLNTTQASTSTSRATTTTTRATTTTTEEPREDETTTTTDAPPETVPIQDSEEEQSAEEPVQSTAETERTVVVAGEDVGVTAGGGGGEESFPPGATVTVEVKPAIEGSTAVFAATATVNDDGTVSLNVNVPEGSPPGVYLVVIVLPAQRDANGNITRRPQVAIGALVVRRTTTR